MNHIKTPKQGARALTNKVLAEGFEQSKTTSSKNLSSVASSSFIVNDQGVFYNDGD